ncbi:MAG: apolipoprotein N-acyltransferase [Deltaproteobacteria bacterium]|nr:apolipoprotein N-acyltransferase [Deltaproteobacteria bacterium]
MRSRLPWGLASLSGVLYFAGFAGFDQFYLSWICLVPLFWALEGATRRRAIGLGLWMGFVTNAGGYYWLVGMLRDFSGFPTPLCVLFTAILCLYQGGVFAVFSYLVVRGRERLPLMAVAPLSMVLVEFAYPLLFPSYTANSQHVFPIVLQIADILGPLGPTALIVTVNAALYEVLRARRAGAPWPRRDPAIAVAALGATLAYGAVRIGQVEAVMRAAPKVQIGVAQSNMGIYQKWESPREGLRRHRDLSKALQDQGVDLLIWPESAYVYRIPDEERNLKARVLGKRLRTPLLFGAVMERRNRLFNTAVMLNEGGDVTGTYDKTYLLAFGEYLPFGETLPILYDWSPNSGRFTPGSSLEPVRFGPYRLSVLICYEDILARFTRSAVRHARPHLLVNMTNDAWFGDTNEPGIHLALATLRAIEHRRYLVRATNTGVSAFVDPVGRVYAHGPTFEMAKLRAKVGMIRTTTIYERIGDLLGWTAVLGMAFVLHRTRRSRS